MLSNGGHMISFDKVVQIMKQTGRYLPSLYRETSVGGLAYFGADLYEDKRLPGIG